jgi:hypothetical protein
MPNYLSPKLIMPELHTALGFGITLGFWVFLHQWFKYAMLIFLIVVIVKEVYWDPKNEVGQPFLWEGAQDLLWYIVGSGIVFGLIYL